MTIEGPPLWLQGGTYSARLDRMLIAQSYDEGVRGPASCKVTQRGAGANFSVDIAIGDFVIQGDDQALQGNYMGRVTAAENAVIGAAPGGSNGRYDLITLRVNDPNAGGNSGNTVTAVVVAGTPATSPTVPSLPASSILLAVVGPIVAATASITNALINDTQTGTGPAGATVARLLAGRRSNPGALELFAANANKLNGWLYCDGSAVSRTTYADLFAAVGTNYGVGDGSTTFNLPDLRNRVPVAYGASFTSIGATGGEATHTLTTGEMPPHTHGGATGTESVPHTHASGNGGSFVTEAAGAQEAAAGSSGYYALEISGYSSVAATASESVAHTHPIASQGSGTPFTNMPPYQVVSGWAIRI